MRIVLVLSFIMSFSAFAQTRVRENIKQQSVSSSEKKPTPKPIKEKESGRTGRRNKR